MSVVNEPSAQQEVASPTGADVPVRAEGVQLIGEMKGSGYREPPALARRADGQTIQLTGLLYLVLDATDGTRTFDEVGALVSEAFGRTVSGDNVRTLVDNQLRPAGLVCAADGAQPEVQKSNPLLALRFKYAVTDPDRTRRLTAPFGWLFHPLVMVVVLAALAAISWWVFFEKGLASATYQAFEKPGLLLLVVLVTILSAGFHEFGHAAAARRAGATPGVMGAGLYLVWPAFYTDVTDSYRLGRRGRVLTDLGGLYFNSIVAAVIGGVWLVTGYDALLLVVATQILQMVRQLTPLVRFDGYHVLADLTGVPDLFQRIRPTLVGLLPWHWKDPESRILKPWARFVVSAWVLVVVPVLLFSAYCMVIAMPRILGTAWASAGKQAEMLQLAWADADLLGAAARVVALAAVVLPVLAVTVVVVTLVRTLAIRVVHATRDRPARRGLAALLAIALVAGLGYVWWPQEGTYRPIQPFEGGTLTQVAAGAARPATAGLGEGDYGRVTTAWADGDARPTAARPQLALVLVPRGTSGAPKASEPKGDTQAQSWVFPFNKPLAPDKGDNQSLAVNTTDNTVQYDVAFALVWIDDDSPALNTNEAYAFASCKNCAAVSVAFQIVLVSGDNHVAAPQNLSGALNYDCVNCLTYALATQLFVTLDGPLSASGTEQLTRLWQQIATFGASITSVPLNEIRDRLTAYEQQILDIIEADQGDPDSDEGVKAGTGTDPSRAPSGGASPGGAATGTTDDGASTPSDGSTAGSGTSEGADTGSDTGADTGTETGTPTGDGTTTGAPTTKPTPKPTPRATTEPTPRATPTSKSP